MINSLGGEQDNVVFMGRRSFRMEIAGGAHSSELAVPMRASAVPTERIFDADRDRTGWATAAAALQPTRLRSSGTSVVALCATTFVLGIALTLTLTGRAAPRRAPAAAQPAEPSTVTAAPVAAPTPTPPIVIQTMPIAAPTDAEILAGFAFAPPRRPVAKPARAVVRPRAVRAARPAQSADAEASMADDPFADPAPAAKPATKLAAKAWVDPFAE